MTDRDRLAFRLAFFAALLLGGQAFWMILHEILLINTCETVYPHAKCEIVAVPKEGQP